MKVRKGRVKPLAAVKDVSGCGNFGCMTIDGQEAWALKTNEAQDLSVLYYYKNVNKKVSRYYRIKDLLGHGNGMTNDRYFLYFACALVNTPLEAQNRYILRLPRNFRGNLKDAVKIDTPQPVGAISYYKKNHMIVRVPSDVSGYMKFAIGRLSVNEAMKTGRMAYVSSVYVKLDVTGFITQDIYYDPEKRILFIPLNRIDSEGRILINRIFTVDFSGPRERINGSRAFEPMGVIEIDMDPEESGFTKFEVESLGLDAKRRIVLAANSRGKMGDHFYQITNLRF